jgi:hypothetical protein
MSARDVDATVRADEWPWSAEQRAIDWRRAVGGLKAHHEHGLQAIEKSFRDIGADRYSRRLRPINPTSESDSASDSEDGSGETSPPQSA